MRRSTFAALLVLAATTMGCDGDGDHMKLVASPGLYSLDPLSQVLYSVDLRTGTFTPISNVAFQDIQCLETILKPRSCR